MNRDQLAEVLRAASQIAHDSPLVLGSQAILGTFNEDALPQAVTMSMEADVAFLADADRAKADLVTAAIGEDSNFHQLRGYYAEGIHVETATLPRGWQDRLISVQIPAGDNGPATQASFLERHDLVVAKLAAFREKDVRFATALLEADLIDPDVVLQRLAETDLHPLARDRATSLLAHRTRTPSPHGQHETLSPEQGQARLRRSQRRAGDSGDGPAPGIAPER